MMGSPILPRWLPELLKEKFFNACLIHEYAKKNEKNIFCFDCCTSICPHCLSDHRSHRVLQIRRYVYHNVLRLEDAKKLLDCAFIQGYINNGAKVIFLNQRPQTRPCRSSGSLCSTCDRALQEPFLFCSFSCKVVYFQIHHLIRTHTEKGLSKYIFDCDHLSPIEPCRDILSDLDDGRLMTPDSVLEPVRTSSESGDSVDGAWSHLLYFKATANSARKKRSSLVVQRVEKTVATGNRRKRTPRRAPLY